MKEKLFANIKRISTIFCISLAMITVAMLGLRLTLFRDMVADPDASIQTSSGRFLSYDYNAEIYFRTMEAKGNVLITSHVGNNCYMRVIIRDADSNTLLDTGKLEPGQAVKTAPFSKYAPDMEDGVYPCAMQVIAYDRESNEILNQEQQPVTLYIGITPGEAAESGLTGAVPRRGSTSSEEERDPQPSLFDAIQDDDGEEAAPDDLFGDDPVEAPTDGDEE